MTEDEIVRFVTGLGGVAVTVASEDSGAPEVAWGDTFLFYDPDGDLPDDRRFPFATIVTGDYPGDEGSDLGRPGVFRLNVSVGRPTFDRLFPDPAADHDPAALDTPVPHPVYGAQAWVSIVVPGPRTTTLARELLTEAHERARARHEARARRQR